MEQTVINVMSYNIGGDSYKVSPQTGLIGENVNLVLSGEDIDVVGFQEVTVEQKWVKWMRENLDESYSVIAAQTRDAKIGAYIAYRKEKLEIVDDGIFWLYDGAPQRAQKYEKSDFQRICNWALFRVVNTGEIFIFMNTQLDTNSDVRSLQAEVVVSKISAIRDDIRYKLNIDDCPVVLVGDMKAYPDTPEYGVIADKLVDSMRICGKKSDSASIDMRMDYVFVSEGGISVLNYKTVIVQAEESPHGEFLSDRGSVVVTLGLNAEKRADKYAKRYYEDSLDIPRFETEGYYSWNVFEGGSGLYSIETDSVLHVREFCVNEVTPQEIHIYTETLKNNGFDVDGQTVGEYVSFTSFWNGKKRIVLSYEERKSVARIIIDCSGVTPQAFSYSTEAKENESAEIYQYGLEQLHKYTENGVATGFYSANGMSYVIKCADNSLIIIDGGQRSQMIGENGDYAPAEQYNDFLHAITGISYDEKIRISCWYLTHAHDDHDQGFCEFIRRFHSQYELERVCANTPSVNDPIWGPADLKLLKVELAAFINKEYPNCKFYIPHSGDVFNIADVKMQVMLTLEELVDPVTGKTAIVYRDDPSVFNDTSTVIKMWLGGMTALITGDIANLGGPKITELYSESLRSDIIQAAHHGGNLLPELYKSANAKYVLVPLNHMNTIYKKYFQIRYSDFSQYSDVEYFSGCYDMTVGLAYRKGKITEVWSPKIRTLKNFFELLN